MSARAEPTPAVRRAVAWAAIVGVYAAVRLPLLAVPLERDEGLFGVIGQAILRGEVPYRDVFEHKPPGGFYLYALALLVVPPTAAGVHAFLAVWNFGTLLCVASLAGTLAGPAAARWAGLLFAIGSAAPSVQGFSASTEMLLLLPLAASVRLAIAGPGGRTARQPGLLAASGALAAVTFWIKQPAVLAAAVGPLAIVVAGRRRPRDAARALAAWSAGALAATAAIVVPFVALAGREFWYWAFEHSWLYGQLPVPNWPRRLLAAVLNLGRDFGVPLAAALAGAASAVGAEPAAAGVALAFLALSVASAFHSPFLYVHYFALLVPATAVAGGAGLAWLHARVPGAAFAAAAVALVVGVPVAAAPWYWVRPDPVVVSVRTLGPQGFEGAPLVAAYLRARTTPEDRIFVYGSEPQIPFTAERIDVNPFGMVYPLTWTWPRHREFQEVVWARIERGRPVYVVLARTPTSLVRSPDVDPFLETRLDELGRRAYALEAVLLADANGLRFAAEPPADPRAARVLFELWRRRD